MTVPFLDLARENKALGADILAAVGRVLGSGRVLYGAELEAFEVELAAWFGVKHAVGVASGTDAVEIALRAVGAADRTVVCAAMTAVPCANAIEAAGARIRLADVRENGNVELAAGHSVDEIGLAVSLFGAAVDVGAEPLNIEDIAHAMGARDKHGRLVGTRCAAGAVSLYPTKILGAVGDGGAVITDNDEIARRVRTIRHYGFNSDNVTARGQNSRLSEIQAAILRVKLPHVEGWIQRRGAIASRYSGELRNVVHVQPWRYDQGRNAYHVYVVRHPERDRIVAALKERGIGTMIHYPRAIHQHDRWRHLGYDGQFPVAEALAREVFSLPCYPFLTDEEQTAVIAAVKDVT